jgi:hypothetical protein
MIKRTPQNFTSKSVIGTRRQRILFHLGFVACYASHLVEACVSSSEAPVLSYGMSSSRDVCISRDPDRHPAARSGRRVVWGIILSACGGTAQDFATHPVPGRRNGRLGPLDCIRRRANRPCGVRGGSTPYRVVSLRRRAHAVHSINHVTMSGCGVERCG